MRLSIEDRLRLLRQIRWREYHRMELGRPDAEAKMAQAHAAIGAIQAVRAEGEPPAVWKTDLEGRPLQVDPKAKG